MDYHKIKFGSKFIFSLVIFMIFSDNSSWNVFGVENEQFESMVEGAENDLSCGSTSSG